MGNPVSLARFEAAHVDIWLIGTAAAFRLNPIISTQMSGTEVFWVARTHMWRLHFDTMFPEAI